MTRTKVPAKSPRKPTRYTAAIRVKIAKRFTVQQCMAKLNMTSPGAFGPLWQRLGIKPFKTPAGPQGKRVRLYFTARDIEVMRKAYHPHLGRLARQKIGAAIKTAAKRRVKK